MLYQGCTWFCRLQTNTLTLLLALLLGLSGCTSRPTPPAPELRDQLGRIAIVALPASPRGEFHTFAKGWPAGAAKGAAIGSAEGVLYAFSQGASSAGGGPYAAAASTLAAMIFTVVGSAIMGVAGGIQAVPVKTSQEIEARINQVLEQMDLSRDLANAVYAAGQPRNELGRYRLSRADDDTAVKPSAYASLASAGLDTVAEVQVTEAGFQGGAGREPHISFYLNAHVRLLDSRTGNEHYGRDFHYSSQERPFAEWLDNGAVELSLGFEQAQAILAERIVDELFLVTRFPFASGLWALPGQPEFGTCWFRPIQPAIEYSSLWYSIRHNAPGIHMLYPVVTSVQPLLEWEPLPRPRDLVAQNEALIRQIGNVTYDLKVWEAPNDFPQRLVCDLSGLAEPRHQFAEALKPKTKYFWTVRARYKLAGKPQATRWAFSLIPTTAPGMPPGGSCELDEIPTTSYFRFVTP